MGHDPAAFCIIALFFIGIVFTIHIRTQAGPRARITLVAYLGIVSEYNDRRMTVQYQMGLVEDALIKRIHLQARRGIRIIDDLLAHGAITFSKRDQAYRFFRDCEHAQRRTAAPRKLPELEIDPCGDKYALKAQAEWHELVKDAQILRKHATSTFEYGFAEFFTEPGSAWEK